MVRLNFGKSPPTSSERKSKTHSEAVDFAGLRVLRRTEVRRIGST